MSDLDVILAIEKLQKSSRWTFPVPVHVYHISNKYTHTIETYTKIVSSVPVNYLQLCRTVR